MQEPVLRRLFLGFIQIHILRHAKKEPFFGSWMIEELEHHNYKISAGTLYPILHNLEKNGLLFTEKKTVAGKVRKYYGITDKGEQVLFEANQKVKELIREL